MKKFLVKSVSTATKENPNFAGSVITYWTGKKEAIVASEGTEWNDIEMNPYFVEEYGYNRMCDAKRSYDYKHPENSRNWTTVVEIVTVEI